MEKFALISTFHLRLRCKCSSFSPVNLRRSPELSLSLRKLIKKIFPRDAALKLWSELHRDFVLQCYTNGFRDFITNRYSFLPRTSFYLNSPEFRVSSHHQINSNKRTLSQVVYHWTNSSRNTTMGADCSCHSTLEAERQAGKSPEADTWDYSEVGFGFGISATVIVSPHRHAHRELLLDSELNKDTKIRREDVWFVMFDAVTIWEQRDGLKYVLYKGSIINAALNKLFGSA